MNLREEVENFCLGFSIEKYDWGRSELLSTQARAVADGIIPWEVFLRTTMHIFYLTGIIGLKTESYESYQWAHEGTATVVADTIGMETSAMIHPMFHRVLGIKPDKR